MSAISTRLVLSSWKNSTSLPPNVPHRSLILPIGEFIAKTSRSASEMPPSCVTMVPPGMDNGSLFPVMDLYALPSTLVPPVMAQADPERVQNMAAELRHFDFVPINLADNIAEALIVGIQLALAIAGGRR